MDDVDLVFRRLLDDERHGVSFHEPARPSWLCRSCREPWPCLVRKRELAHTFDSLLPCAFYMLGWLELAVHDHPDHADDLIGRFLHDLRSIRFTDATNDPLEGSLSTMLGARLPTPLPDRGASVPSLPRSSWTFRRGGIVSAKRV